MTQMSFNIDRLKQVCLAPFEWFLEEYDGTLYHIPSNQRERFIFIDRGADVLAVGHADIQSTAATFRHFGYTKFDPPLNGYITDRVFCSSLDDRLGLYIILEMLPKLGINVDVLITDLEEVGQSTASIFSYATVGLERKYNWIAEFDRHGHDWVAYEYHSQEWDDAARSAGFEVGSGTFTDICELEDLGCKAMNVAIGYHQEHSGSCYADLNVTVNQLKKFVKFWEMYKDTHFPHTKTAHTGKYTGRWPGTNWDGDWNSYYDDYPTGKGSSEKKDPDDNLNDNDKKNVNGNSEKRPYGSDNTIKCRLCSGLFNIRVHNMFMHEGSLICPNCFYKNNTSSCHKCGVRIDPLDLEQDADGEIYCKECMLELYHEELYQDATTCRLCGKVIMWEGVNSAIYNHNIGDHVCKNCNANYEAAMEQESI